MGGEAIRAHVVLPPELVQEVDRLVGQRRRSQFFAEAVREKLVRIRLAAAARKAAGSLATVPIPEWETGESAARWVRSSRQADEQRLAHRLSLARNCLRALATLGATTTWQ